MAIRPRPTPRPGGFAVRAHGVDLNRLDRREQHEDVLEGWTTLTGYWRRHQLYVQTQTPWRSPTISQPNRWTTPPCTPPPHGWPDLGERANLEPSPPSPDQWQALTITQITQFRPGPTQAVLVVAAEEPERVERVLRPSFGDALCVVPSRYTWRQIDEAAHGLRLAHTSHQWPISRHGRGASDDGQAQLAVTLAWMVPEMIVWAAPVPTGLLAPDVWLTPVDTSDEHL